MGEETGGRLVERIDKGSRTKNVVRRTSRWRFGLY
jgi:hypothetical protein